MNYKDADVHAYRKVLTTLKLVPVEGTEKAILVKQGLMEGTMDRYCLPRRIAEQVIRDVHLTHMHLGMDGTTRQAQKFVWMPGLYSMVRNKVAKCARCVQKQKIQKDVRVEHCFSTREKGRAAQIVHIDLARPMPDTKEGFKYILGLANNFHPS